MTPKEKAEELIDKFQEYSSDSGIQIGDELYDAKQCALIAVDECINIHFNLESDKNGIGKSFKYWKEVKQEIELL